ncbi:hypothetical protein HAZT_HAZT000563 [Hyalella azteca]|nr:hypothetical protein HAZT_HAZT000563 [Hyalella azteca]
MKKQLEKKLVLSEDSETIGNFISPPVPIFMQFYIFNVTNAPAVLEGEKAVLDQIGPFTYEEKRMKFDLFWELEDKTVEYQQNKTFFFRADMSNGLTEDTLLTVVNPVLISLGAKFSRLPSLTHGILQLLALRHDMSPFITRKAGHLLYHGYDEPLLEQLSPLTRNPIHAMGKFGFFFPKNHSSDGIYRIHTGAQGLNTLQVIDEFQEEPMLPYWLTDVCNMINGTEGSQFPQPITEDKKLMMYSSDLCRSLYFKFEKKINHGDLVLNRYTLPYEVLAKSPENDCFCSDDFTCRDSMVNLSPCKDGSPVVASTPHFYMGTEETINDVVGLNPVKEEHETYLDIEPNTGVTFRAHKRLQINMPLKRYEALPDLQKVREVILPIMWLNESAVVPVERADALNAKLTVPLIVVRYVCIAMVAMGVIILLLALAFIVKMCKAPKNEKEKVNEKLKKEAINDYDRSEVYKHLFTKA